MFKVLNPVRGITHILTSPIQLGLKETASEIRQSAFFFVRIDEVRYENLKLIEQVVSLESQIVDLQSASLENDLLRKQLDLRDEFYDKDLVIADVLGNINDQTDGSVVLNKGSKHGIKPGDNVIIGKHLVGIVTETSFGRSVVDLVTSPSVSVAVYDIDTQAKTAGLANGQFGTGIQMTRILPQEEIFVGDTIVTSGLDGWFEPGLIVGEVVDVFRDSAQPLKNAYLRTIVDVGSVDKLFVIVER